MTDVLRKIISANGTKNSAAVTGVTNTGEYSRVDQGINKDIPMSGVNGQTTNGYLDTRYEDVDYYTA